VNRGKASIKFFKLFFDRGKTWGFAGENDGKRKGEKALQRATQRPILTA
jgi:hypothetical protein